MFDAEDCGDATCTCAFCVVGRLQEALAETQDDLFAPLNAVVDSGHVNLIKVCRWCIEKWWIGESEMTSEQLISEFVGWRDCADASITIERVIAEFPTQKGGTAP